MSDVNSAKLPKSKFLRIFMFFLCAKITLVITNLTLLFFYPLSPIAEIFDALFLLLTGAAIFLVILIMKKKDKLLRF